MCDQISEIDKFGTNGYLFAGEGYMVLVFQLEKSWAGRRLMVEYGVSHSVIVCMNPIFRMELSSSKEIELLCCKELLGIALMLELYLGSFIVL